MPRNTTGLSCLREDRYYSRHSIAVATGISPDQTAVLVQDLIRDGVAESLFRRGEQFIVPRFVGLIVHPLVTFLVLPKMVPTSISRDDKTQYVKLLTQAAARYSSDFPEATLSDLRDFVSTGDVGQISRMRIAIKLLDHWVVHGWHHHATSDIVLNGDGEIDWLRTIDEELPYTGDDGSIYYLTYRTEKTGIDETNPVRRLHRSILSDCERFLIALGVFDLFASPIPSEAPDLLSDMAAAYDLKALLHHELRTTYNESTEERLRLMLAYLETCTPFDDADRIHYLGTRSFHRIWESASAWALGNQLSEQRVVQTTFSPVTFHPTERFEYSPDQLPHWSFEDGRESLGSPGEPDILISGYHEDPYDEFRYFWILDAKYYDALGAGATRSLPGINDIVKQHMYQFSFEQRITSDSSFSRRNAFLFPSNDVFLEFFGTVELPFIRSIGLTQIDLIALSLTEILGCYIQGAKGALRTRFLNECTANEVPTLTALPTGIDY